MSEPQISPVELFPVAIEGAVDRFVGRPRDRNPYSWDAARPWAEAWLLGWDDAHHLLEQRGQEEATRWLTEAA